MSSQVSRHFYSIAAATLMLTAGMSRTAMAKDCTTDSDCDTGYQCNLAPVGGGTSGAGGATGISTPGTAASPPVPAPDLPVPVSTDGGIATLVADAGVRTPTSIPDAGLLPTVPPIIGTCEPKPIVCTSVADCPADFECVKDMIAVAEPPCPTNTKCATPPPQTSDTGACHAVPHACSTAADCPAPLVCQAQGATCSGGASVGPDGVITTMPETCTQGTSVCTYVPKSCTSDSECADSYQCVKVSEGGSCSGSAGVCTRSDAGVICSTPDPPVCTSYVVMNCLPKQIADASGKSCLPDGLILAVGGHAANSGSTVINSSGTAGGDQSGSVPLSIRGDAGVGSGTNSGTPTGVAPGPAPSADPAAPGSGANGTKEGTGTTATKAQGGGCALGGGHPASNNLWLALALLGLVLRVARRRPSGRR
jgi:MYXO-CTERM domain-containing protein